MKQQVSIAFMLCGMLFTVCLIVANIVEQKLIQIGPIEATAGLLIFPISYIVNDVIAEVWGYKKASLIIWMGFLMNLLAVVVFRLSIWVPGSENFTHQEAFSLVLGNTQRITIASFIAFLCGSFLNAFVMSRMKVLQKGKGFSLRAIVSTIAGEGADSIIFFTIAFAGQISLHDILNLVMTQTIMKTTYEIIMLPITGERQSDGLRKKMIRTHLTTTSVTTRFLINNQFFLPIQPFIHTNLPFVRNVFHSTTSCRKFADKLLILYHEKTSIFVCSLVVAGSNHGTSCNHRTSIYYQ